MLMAASSQGWALATAKSLPSFANKTGYLPFNVGAALELLKVKDTLSERILTEAEAHRLMNAPKSARDRALISVLYAGALRRKEAVRLKWRDLKTRDDLAAGIGQATIFGKGSKTGVALLPASVFSDELALRRVTERRTVRSRRGLPRMRIPCSRAARGGTAAPDTSTSRGSAASWRGLRRKPA